MKVLTKFMLYNEKVNISKINIRKSCNKINLGNARIRKVMLKRKDQTKLCEQHA